jgi:hypothetical protein
MRRRLAAAEPCRLRPKTIPRSDRSQHKRETRRDLAGRSVSRRVNPSIRRLRTSTASLQLRVDRVGLMGRPARGRPLPAGRGARHGSLPPSRFPPVSRPPACLMRSIDKVDRVGRELERLQEKYGHAGFTEGFETPDLQDAKALCWTACRRSSLHGTSVPTAMVATVTSLERGHARSHLPLKAN